MNIKKMKKTDYSVAGFYGKLPAFKHPQYISKLPALRRKLQTKKAQPVRAGLGVSDFITGAGRKEHLSSGQFEASRAVLVRPLRRSAAAAGRLCCGARG